MIALSSMSFSREKPWPEETRITVSEANVRDLMISAYRTAVGTRLMVDWGDGTSVTTTVTESGYTPPAHRYADAGTYVIRVCADVDGSVPLWGSFIPIYQVEAASSWPDVREVLAIDIVRTPSTKGTAVSYMSRLTAMAYPPQIETIRFDASRLGSLRTLSIPWATHADIDVNNFANLDTVILSSYRDGTLVFDDTGLKVLDLGYIQTIDSEIYTIDEGTIEDLTLRHTSVVQITDDEMEYIADDLSKLQHLRVPANLVDAYKSHPVWSAWAYAVEPI